MSLPKGYLTIVADVGALVPWGEAKVVADFVVPFPCSPCTCLPNWVAVADTGTLTRCGTAAAVTGI